MKEFDTHAIKIDEFSKRAKKELECFATNIKGLNDAIKNASLSLFEWYEMFSKWNES